MMKFLKMNLSLVKFLMVELPKKKSIKEVVIFLKKIAVQYFKVLLQEYKNLFLFMDEDYQTQKKAFDKNQEIKKALQTALRMLQYIDKKMVEAGKSRQERKLFWRDFYKTGSVRTETFNDLTKEIDRIR